MVKSMTGFGRATSNEGNSRSFSIELKSVNHRYLDLNVRMPKSILSLEEKVRKALSEKLSRGKVDVFITYKNYGDEASEATLNTVLADSYFNSLETLFKRYEDKNIKNDISVSLIARFPDVIKLQEKEENLEEMWCELNKALDEALGLLVHMREVEGEKLKADIKLKCALIEDMLSKVEEKAPSVVIGYKEKLKERVKELCDNIQVDESRINMEIALFADKASIDEEITRLHSHIEQVRSTLELDESIGRKLDFIVQEMNREANTIASKSTDLEITNIVLNIKNEIEKIREQVQNIE